MMSPPQPCFRRPDRSRPGRPNQRRTVLSRREMIRMTRKIHEMGQNLCSTTSPVIC